MEELDYEVITKGLSREDRGDVAVNSFVDCWRGG